VDRAVAASQKQNLPNNQNLKNWPIPLTGAWLRGTMEEFSEMPNIFLLKRVN